MTMTHIDYVVHLILSLFIIIGVYQCYFWCQRNVAVNPRDLGIRVDAWIPYWPSWVWIYSFLYYPVILYLNLVVESSHQFTQLVISYVLLLALQTAFFLAFPVVTPEKWRTCNTGRTASERFLAYVQTFDGRANCFPSMHCSVAMLTALHLFPYLGPGAYAFPLLIGLSSLFTKQHFLVDVPAGVALGWGTFELFKLLP